MALKVWDGFDHYNATADLLNRSGFLQYQTPGTFTPSIAFVTGRNGFGKAIKVSNTSDQTGASRLRAVWGTRNAEMYIGAGMLISTATFGAGASLYLRAFDGVANAPQVTLFFNGANFSIQAFRGDYNGTSLGLSANNVWTPQVWNFIEVHFKIDGSAGIIAVHVNGVSVLALTAQNTQATANAWADCYDFAPANPGFASTTQFVTIDDLYYCDTTTGAGLAPCNTFLGDCQVKTLFAVGNDAVQWTPLAGSNWQEVAETTMDSDTSYNYSSTPGQQDTLDFGALAGTITTIYGIQLTYAARKDDAGARSVKSIVKIAGTSYAGATYSLPDTNYAYFTDQWILNPNTGLNWVISGVNGAAYGYNMVS